MFALPTHRFVYRVSHTCWSNAAFSLYLKLFILVAVVAAAGPLVGPGAVGSYQGGGGGRRYGGAVRVQDPPAGIFVAGSSLMDMNGLYARVERVPSSLQHTFQLAYKHDYTGWYMALVGASEEIRLKYGTSTEWILIDNDGVDRFQAGGDSLIPGSGSRWSHVHRSSSSSSEGQIPASKAVTVAVEDDETELPWQVIGIGDLDMLDKLRQHFRYYKHVVQKAIAGDNLRSHQFPPATSPEVAPPENLEVASIPGSSLHGRDCIGVEKDSEIRDAAEKASSKGDKWASAVLHRHLAICSRWKKNFDIAASSVQTALQLFPRYIDALFELGMLHLDLGQYNEAVTAFEKILLLDRKHPGIDIWLVRAHAHLARLKSEDTKRKELSPMSEHCLAWRQTGMCDPWKGPREPAHDRSCDAQVDAGLSGYCECRYQNDDGTSARVAESRCGHHVFTCEEECHKHYSHLPKPGVTRDVCTLADAPAWCSPDHYLALGVRCDLEPPEEMNMRSNHPEHAAGSSSSDELKRAYKRSSLQVHPDKRGGSLQAFQRVALAYETLSDAVKRHAYDMGDELPRQAHHDGTEGLSYQDEIVKKYFPERFGFEPFGDPHADRKAHEKQQHRILERQRQDILAHQAASAAGSHSTTEL